MGILTGVSLAVVMAFASLLLAACETSQKRQELTPAGFSDASFVGGRPKPENDPGRAEGMLRLAADLESRGERDTALTFYERAAAASNGDIRVYMTAGDAFLRLNYPANAANAYRAVLAKTPEDGRALLGLGSALARNGDVGQGLTYLAKAAPLVKTAAAYDRLGVTYVMAGQPREALAAFEQAHAIDARDIDISTNLALAASLSGQNDKAVDLMKTVAKRSDAGLEHKRNLILVMGIAGKGDEAKTIVTDLPPETVQSLLNQAKSIKDLSNAKARALALGTASSTTR